MTRFISAYQIKFDKDYLNQLTQDSDSGVSIQNCKFHVGLHPAQFTDFGQSVKDELGKKIGKYDDLFQGILLGYQNVKLQSNYGVIGLDNCYIHIDIKADFYVFRPVINMVLNGIVTRTTKGHVGCLVYNTFNISLPRPDDEDVDGWLGNKVGIQSEVQFKIIYVDLSSRLPYIRGQLISIIKNNNIQPSGKNKSKSPNQKIKFENVVEEDNDTTSSSKKKQKHTHHKELDILDNMDINEDPGEEEDNNTTPKTKKKNKKKHLEEMDVTVENMVIKQEQPEIEDNISEQEGLTQKSKKKHKRKDKELTQTSDDVEIKLEDLVEQEVKKIKKHKKKKKEKPESDEHDEEVLKKKEKRKEKKIKQEQNDMDISLESLDIKSLFDDSSLNLNNHFLGNQTMANNEDKGKRRKSNSVSQEIYLENVKLEEDSELEKIISGKKRKRSKSISH